MIAREYNLKPVELVKNGLIGICCDVLLTTVTYCGS